MTYEFADLSSNNFQPGQTMDVDAYYHSGVPFVMVKESEGTGYHWAYGDTITDRMHALGGNAGHYHWLRPDQDPTAQANAYIDGLHLATADELMVDVETTAGVGDSPDSQRADQVQQFSEHVRSQLPGYRLGLYTGNWYLAGKPNLQAVARTFPTYLSDYDGTIPDGGIDNPYGLVIVARQFTNQGGAVGIPGRCDMNRWIAGAHTPEGGGVPIGDDMPLNADDKAWISSNTNAVVLAQLKDYFANGEGNPATGRVVQAVTNAVTKYFASGEGNPTSGRVVQAWNSAAAAGTAGYNSLVKAVRDGLKAGPSA